MARIAVIASLLLLAVIARADDASQTPANPYLDQPPQQLRQQIADTPDVFKQNWYQIEVVIFARTHPDAREYWRLNVQPKLSPNPIYLDATAPALPEEADDIDQAAAKNGAWEPLPDSDFVLDDMAGRMKKSGDYRILVHEAWHQPIRDRNHAFSVHVQGGNMLQPLPGQATPPPAGGGQPLMPKDNPEPQMPADDGSAQTSDGTDTTTPAADSTADNGATDNGSLAQDETATGPGTTEAAGPQPELRGDLQFYLERFLHVTPNLWFTSETDNGQRFTVHINQHRRMRSDELHYIDHPLFGLLVRVTKWEPPQQKALDQMKDALEQQMSR